MLGKTLKNRVKEILGTCISLGMKVEGKSPKEILRAVDAGAYDSKIKAEKTELTAEELKQMEEERRKLAEEIEKRKAEFEALAKKIIAENAGKERSFIKAKMIEAGLPDKLIKELLPVEAAAAAAPGEEKKEVAKPAAEKKEEKKK